MLQVQRAAGNRAAAELVQRYKTVDTGGYGVTPDTSPQARAPFTLVSSEMSALPRPGGRAGLGMGYATTTPNQPPLLVADDDSLAINSQQGEPKEFYAAPTVISNATKELADSGSPVELYAAGNQVTLGPGKQLVMVQPKLREEQAPGRDEFAVLANTICRDTAKEIMAGITHAKVGTGGAGTTAPLDITGSQAVGGVHELGGKLAGGDVSVGEAKKTLAEGKSEAVQTPELAGKEYGLSLHGGAAATRARALGLNEGASAGVGEGYLTQTVGSREGTDVDFTSGAAQRRDFVWGYHFSSVIAESLNHADQIAMENYSRTGDWIEGRKVLLAELKRRYAAQIAGVAVAGKDHEQIGQILHFLEKNAQPTAEEAKAAYDRMFKERIQKTGAMWYFRIVGSKPGQSFHEQQAASGYFANPLTMAVTSLQLPSTTVMFDEASSTLTATGTAALDRFARIVNKRRARGAQIGSINVKGWATGSGLGLTAKSLAKKRARAAAAYLEAVGVDPALLRVETGRSGEWGAGGASRRVEVKAAA